MNTLRNAVTNIYMLFCSIYSAQNSNDSLISTKFPGLIHFLLPCWIATSIQYPDSNWIPQLLDSNLRLQYMEPPLFNIHFEDTCHLVSRYESGPNEIQPNIMLCFYPISQKATLVQIIDKSSIYSWHIPVKYDETNEYFIITSPAFLNNGCMSNEAKKYFQPQDSALHTFFSGSLSTNNFITNRNHFAKKINYSNSKLSTQYLLNGRLKTGCAAAQPTIRQSDLKFKGNGSDWILHLLSK